MNPLDLFERMLLIRAYEEKVAELHAQGHFPMTCSSQGQEASAVGVMSVLRPEDRILTNHRSAGHLLARGADPGLLLAEVMGKASGYCGGKSGSLHISVASLGVILTSTIVGGELSMAPGVALAKSMRKESGVVVCFFGDGAACEGIFHESLNLASVWSLPILYVCENNQWQAFVRREETMRTDHISHWAQRYDMATETIDGNDVMAVRASSRAALDYVEQQRRPFLLETWTYRQCGHYSGDNQAHISVQERAPWLEKDPITRSRAELIRHGALTADQAESMQAHARARIEDALAFASASSYPSAECLLTDVYA
ncbi:MAG TPA: thiamine pyrophosphate-dependent dehydrogenase E1 component subunit alpha [Aquabacterium sp.]|nr:thiamine pyrophosphate-dependent dehydrogenase E1 component subunit alpha [Aquabacterium sp.]